jgi:hypothetical protein
MSIVTKPVFVLLRAMESIRQVPTVVALAREAKAPPTVKLVLAPVMATLKE